MITDAQIRSLNLSLEKLAKKQNFLAPNILLNQIRGLGSNFQSQFTSLKIEETDLPHFTGLMLTSRIIKNFMNLVSVCDPKKADQVYLVFLVAGFYSVFIYQFSKVSVAETRRVFTRDEMRMLGYNSASDKRLKELFDLAKMDAADFSKISLDANQIAYLKAAIIKINILYA